MYGQWLLQLIPSNKRDIKQKWQLIIMVSNKSRVSMCSKSQLLKNNLFICLLTAICLIPSFLLAQIKVTNEEHTKAEVSIDDTLPHGRLIHGEPKGKPIPPPEDARNTNQDITARLAACSGTTVINGCKGSVTINKSCLQSNQYFTYAYYHTQWGNIACFARTDQSCNITTEGWGMCLDYNKSVPQIGANGCYTTYYRTTDLTCAGLTPLEASRILWVMSNATAWGLNMANQNDREALNEVIWQITNPSDWPCQSMCAAAQAAVTTPYTDIECRLTFLCPNNTTIQPMVLFSGISGGNPISVGGTVSPNQTICLGQNTVPVKPSVSAYVGTILRWEYASPGGAWVNWGGAGSVIAPSNCCFNTVGVWKVRAIVQNGVCPEHASSEATVTVVAPPTISAQPTNITECISGTRSLSVSATGGVAPLTYQWQNGGLLGTSWNNISGATSATYTPLSTTVGITQYRVIITSTGTNCTTTTSSNATVTIVPDPSVSVNIPPNTVCVGANVTLTATPIVLTGSCTVQWQSSPDGTTWTNITGATGNTYNVTSLGATTRYRAQLISCTGNGCCN